MAAREPVTVPQDGPGVLECAALLASGTGPGSALLLRALVEAVRFRYVGRETTLRSGDAEVRLVPTAVAASGVGARALATGRLDEVRLGARDVVRPTLRLRELTVVASDVRLQPAPAPELITGPVEIEAALDPDLVSERLRERVPGLVVTVDADGVPRARLRNRPGFGAADLEVSVDGHTLSWAVAGLTVAGRRFGSRRSVRTRRPRPLRTIRSGQITVTGLPSQLHLHDVALAPGRITVRGTLPGWRRTIPPARIDDVLRGALSLLDLGR